MTVGDILDRGLKVLLARLPAFYAINLLVLSPVILVQIATPFVVESGGGMSQAAAIGAVGTILFVVLLTLILQPIGTAAILYMVMEEYAGRRASIGQAFSFALTRFLPLIGTSILVGLIVVIGTMFCCVPGIYFAILYAFAGQVVVLEKLSGGSALRRSQELVTGFWWRVFGVLFLVGIANAVIQMVMGVALNHLLPPQEIIPTEDGPHVKVNAANQVITTLIEQLVSILFSTFIAVCTTILYLDQRIRKEGFDMELAGQLGEEPGSRPAPRGDDIPDDLDDPERRRRRMEEF